MANGAPRASQPPAGIRISRAADNARLTSFTELVKGADWFARPSRPGRLRPGDLTPRDLTVPQRDAQAALRSVVRLVADLPVDSTPIVVWEEDGSELLVDTASISIACTEGLVTISIVVSCDQAPERTRVSVPFGVGTSSAPTGLVMSTLHSLDGPQTITARWSEAITAFAWESLIEMARRVCEQLGRDGTGKPLVPGSIASAKGALLIQPMSRTSLSIESRMT